MKNIVENQDIKTDKDEIEGLRNQLAAVVAERDAARNAIAAIYKSVTGENPEWSNWTAYLDDVVEEMGTAVREIESRGVEKLAERWRTAEKLANDDGEFRAAHGLAFDAVRAEKFAAELREHSQEVERG